MAEAVQSLAHQLQPRLHAIRSTQNRWQEDAAKALRREVHALLKQADVDMPRRQYNTVVSACMKMLNTLDEAAKTTALPEGTTVTPTELEHALHEGLSILLRVLYPVVPHIGWTPLS